MPLISKMGSALQALILLLTSEQITASTLWLESPYTLVIPSIKPALTLLFLKETIEETRQTAQKTGFDKVHKNIPLSPFLPLKALHKTLPTPVSGTHCKCFITIGELYEQTRQLIQEAIQFFLIAI